MKRRVIITCGPAIAPIDGVRRITNVSTGEIGTILADVLAGGGCDVLCLRGEGSTASPPQTGCTVASFTTNDSLLEILGREAGRATAVLHAAALCDFEVVPPTAGTRKIRSDAGGLTLQLIPAPKVLPRLRGLFPSALLVGWKYELDGTREDAIGRARAQLHSNATDACIVNGSAYGPGFGLIESGYPGISHFEDKHQLANGLHQWLIGRWR